MGQSNKLRISDIAKKAQVSISTVSRVLSNPQYPVSKEIKERVQAIVNETGYQPNLIGRILKTKINPTVGIIVPTYHNQYFTQLIIGAEQAASNKGFYSLAVSSHRNPILERRLITNFKNSNVNALLIASIDENANHINDYITSGGMVCLLESNDLNLETVINAQSDYLEAARKATEFLISNGHKRIAYLTAPLTRSSRSARLDGIRFEMTKNKLQFSSEDVFIYNHETDNTDSPLEVLAGKNLANQFLKMKTNHTAVIVSNDMMAIGVLDTFKEMNIPVPAKISVISFDNITFSEYTYPKLTTVDLYPTPLGKNACNILIDAIKSKTYPENIIVSANVNLIIRDSVQKIT